jgi:hypothetical protein
LSGTALAVGKFASEEEGREALVLAEEFVVSSRDLPELAVDDPLW